MVADKHRDRIDRIPIFESKDFINRGGVERVGAQAIKRFGGKNDHVATLERGDSG